MAKKPTADDIMGALSKVDVTEKPTGSAAKAKAAAPSSGGKGAAKEAPKKAKAVESKDARIHFHCTEEQKLAVKMESAKTGKSVGDIFIDAVKATGLFDS